MSFPDMLGSNDVENGDDDTKPRNMFSGGAKSSLQITDSNNNKRDLTALMKDLLEKAKRNSEQRNNLQSSNAIGKT